MTSTITTTTATTDSVKPKTTAVSTESKVAFQGEMIDADVAGLVTDYMSKAKDARQATADLFLQVASLPRGKDVTASDIYRWMPKAIKAPALAPGEKPTKETGRYTEKSFGVALSHARSLLRLLSEKDNPLACATKMAYSFGSVRLALESLKAPKAPAPEVSPLKRAQNMLLVLSVEDLRTLQAEIAVMLAV